MSEDKKKEEEIIEKKPENIDILDDIKIAATLESINYLQTKNKGIFLWGTPYGSTFEDHFKILKLINEKTVETQELRIKQDEENKNKQAEEELKKENIPKESK